MVTNNPQYLDVDPQAVTTAGHWTAATAEQWRSWGHRARTRFEMARPDLRSTRVAAALWEYAGRWRPELLAVSAAVADLGIRTIAAAGAVDHADEEAAGSLSPTTAAAEEQHSQLRRPINSERVVEQT